ncbi:hypothetical protein [Pasteurella multocida]|uniref:hypothetical protein n=1 Tax=Pasteurella multocida TaxID=747 RepID=UPI0024491A69|nr:hypothetical protein [Pasteurella multocida]MDH3001700.1 hypothetical protein [Pasteurella multocida]
MKQKFIFITSMALVGCTGLLEGDDEPWVKYKDIDASVKAVRFTVQERVGLQSDSKGIVYQREYFDFDKSTLLGKVYHIYDANQTPMQVIFLDSKKKRSLNPKNEQDMMKLGKATQFDFYEFGKGRIAHVVFSAKTGLCQDFKSKRGVALKMATNYYTDEKYKGYYTSFIHAVIRQNGQHTDFTYSPDFSIEEAQTRTVVQASEKQDGEKLAQINLKEKVTLLSNIVCQ